MNIRKNHLTFRGKVHRVSLLNKIYSMKTTYGLSREMKNELLAKTAEGENAKQACDVVQIDWNLFIFFDSTGRKELRNLLRWEHAFEIESFKKIQYGLYVIKDEHGDLLIDTRIPCNITIGNLISYQEISPNVFLCQMELHNGRRLFTLYHLEHTQQKKKHAKSTQGFDEDILLFENYEKLSEEFYLLYDGDSKLLYNIIYDWVVSIKDYKPLTEEVYLLEIQEEYSSPKYCIVSSRDTSSPCEEDYFSSYQTAGRIFIMKKCSEEFCFYDINSGNKGTHYSGTFHFDTFQEEQDGVIFTSHNGSACKIFYDELAFHYWQFT